MAEMSIEQLAAILDEIVDLSGVEVCEEAVLGEDIAMDSRDMLRVLTEIESRYRVRFAPQEVVRLITMGDLLEMVQRHAESH